WITDELFGGYPTTIATRAFDRYRLLPKFLRSTIFPAIANLLPTSFDRVSFDYKVKRFVNGAASVNDTDAANFVWRGAFYPQERARLYTPNFWSAVGGRRPFSAAVAAMGDLKNLSLDDRMTLADLRVYLADLYLVKADMVSMA